MRKNKHGTGNTIARFRAKIASALDTHYRAMISDNIKRGLAARKTGSYQHCLVYKSKVS